MTSAPLIPAAQYLRMSTEHQQYSLANQAAAIQQYADKHGYEVVQTYQDAGRTGLILKNRAGLRSLLHDVVAGASRYRAVLVYDVSRWGRFQDTDEAAHYEFLCRSAGIPVHYCAETFANDGTLISSVLKAVKRTMAAEYSRELGVKCFEGQKRIALLGYLVCGMAGYGYRRVLLSADGKRKRKLKGGERKAVETERVVLALGPKEEVKWVRHMFRMTVRYPMAEVVRDLNRRGAKSPRGGPWTQCTLARILTNPKYCGWNVWARTECKLHTPRKQVPPSQWVVKRGAFPPIVSEGLFNRVQQAHRGRQRKRTNEELLARLRKLLVHKGKLNEDIINRARRTICARSTAVRRFGSIMRLYELVGYRPSHRARAVSESYAITRQVRRRLFDQIESLFPGLMRRYHIPGHCRDVLQLDNGQLVSVCLCMNYKTANLKLQRWEFRPFSAEKGLPVLLCLRNETNTSTEAFWFVPDVPYDREYQIKNETDHWLRTGERLTQLEDLYDTIVRVLGKRVPMRATA